MNINQKEILELADLYETPFYLYDGNYLFRHYHNIRNQLYPEIEIFLSLKANNNTSIAKLFETWGAGVEVASKGELYLALKAGFKPENIIFSGPGKKIEEIKYAVKNKIYSIIVESVLELELVQALSKEENSVTNIAVRVNPDKDLSNSTIKMSGVARQFGIDESQLSCFFKKLETCPNVNYLGIHVYTGTQNLDASKIIESFKYIFNVARKIYYNHGRLNKMMNLGGGFGVPYFNHEKPLDMQFVINKLNHLVGNAEKSIFGQTRFIIESGRYLLAQAGIYITKILYSKVSKGEKFYIVDGGLHHHAASTFRGRMVRSNFEIRSISRNETADTIVENANIVGPLCTPEDCLAKSIHLASLAPGDLICLLNSGAYGLTYSPVHFLGHPTPSEILKLKDSYIQIRERGQVEDILLRQKIVDYSPAHYERLL